MELDELQKNEKKRILISAVAIIIIGIASFLIFGLKSDKKENDEPYNPNEVETSELTYAFLKLEDNGKNMVYSPLSVKYALSMLKEGASGKTLEEIEKILGASEPTKYENIDKVLSLANSIFIRDKYRDNIKNDYINTIKAKYNAEVIYDSFKDAVNVNKWIEDKTFGIIKNMVNDDLVQDPDSKILLVNALAIDMTWENQFENENTHSAIFTNGDEHKEVAMMHQTIMGRYVEYYLDDDYTSVALPLRSYGDVQLEFIAVMPNSDLHAFVTSNDFETKINNVLSKLNTNQNAEVNISLPRFAFNKKLSLTKDLQQLGMKISFSADADFYKIGDTGLHVDEVLHKADVKVSEKGIKAAAATVISLKDSALLEPDEIERVNLVFDKPFVFIIRDKNTKEIWFVGDVYEPDLWENVKSDYNYE